MVRSVQGWSLVGSQDALNAQLFPTASVLDLAPPHPAPHRWGSPAHRAVRRNVNSAQLVKLPA